MSSELAGMHAEAKSIRVENPFGLAPFYFLSSSSSKSAHFQSLYSPISLTIIPGITSDAMVGQGFMVETKEMLLQIICVTLLGREERGLHQHQIIGAKIGIVGVEFFNNDNKSEGG
jgi:hypothetical protein